MSEPYEDRYPEIWRKYAPYILVAVISAVITSSIFLAAAAIGERKPAALPAPAVVKTAADPTAQTNAFIAARQKVAPAVVYIDVQSVQSPAALPDSGLFPFPELFRHFMQPYIREGTGSGFIFRADGYILTNYHVVENAKKLQVTLADQRKFTGRVVGYDTETDLAVVKINANSLPTVEFGDSDKLEAGEWVLAIGNPLGYHHTVTAGIVSALNRDLNPEEEGYLIQTDAAINPGNSGGPLIDLNGRVVGVNEAIRADAQGMGFAIPINLIKERLDDLIAGRNQGSVAADQPWLGVVLQDLDTVSEDVRREYNINMTEGAIIVNVVADSPAARAGLRRLDVIVAIDKETMRNSNDIQKKVRGGKINQTMAITIYRDGRLQLVRVKLAAASESMAG